MIAQTCSPSQSPLSRSRTLSGGAGGHGAVVPVAVPSPISPPYVAEPTAIPPAHAGHSRRIVGWSGALSHQGATLTSSARTDTPPTNSAKTIVAGAAIRALTTHRDLLG